MPRELRKRAPLQPYNKNELGGSSEEEQEQGDARGIARFTQKGVNNTDKVFEPEPDKPKTRPR